MSWVRSPSPAPLLLSKSDVYDPRAVKEVTVSIAESFGRSAFARFISSPAGRIARLVVGIALIAWGYTQRGSGTGLVLIAVGFLPLITGAFNLCLISALLGGPISSARVGKGSP